jgi:tRNA G37 N-methylase TrmD
MSLHEHPKNAVMLDERAVFDAAVGMFRCIGRVVGYNLTDADRVLLTEAVGREMWNNYHETVVSEAGRLVQWTGTFEGTDGRTIRWTLMADMVDPDRPTARVFGEYRERP